MNDPTDYQSAVEALSPTMVERLRASVATGRWPDGKPLSQEQKENSLRAIITWEQVHLPEEERTGYLPPKDPQAKKSRSIGTADESNGGGEPSAEETLRWVNKNDS
ncbi:MAG: DUF1315 family protein [Pseudomonadota bacterium]